MSATSTPVGKGVARCFHLATLFLFCSALIACGKGGDEPEDEGVLLGILVSPQDVIVPLGGDVQLFATGLYDDRSSRDLTAFVQWTSSSPDVVLVSNKLDQEGVLEGAKAGEAKIEAVMQGIGSVPVRVIVTDADLVGLSLEPSDIVLEKGQTLQLSATAAYSDGSRGDATTQVRWVTSDGTVATLESNGILEAVGQGEAEIHAKLGDLSSGTVPVTVVNSGKADLYVADLTLEPGEGGFTANVRIGNKGTAAATGFFIDLFVDPSSTPTAGDVGDQYGMIEYIAAGEAASATFTFTVDDGVHELAVLVDSDDFVEEKKESNNTAQESVTVGGGSSETGPNLTITYFDYVVSGDTVYYFVDITNAGGEAVADFFVDLFFDSISPPELFDDGEEWIHVESLAAGATTYADFTVTTETLEEVCTYCWSWVMVDGYDEVDETDETDNIEGSITVTY
jgi:hypothetical protein